MSRKATAAHFLKHFDIRSVPERMLQKMWSNLTTWPGSHSNPRCASHSNYGVRKERREVREIARKRTKAKGRKSRRRWRTGHCSGLRSRRCGEGEDRRDGKVAQTREGRAEKRRLAAAKWTGGVPSRPPAKALYTHSRIRILINHHTSKTARGRERGTKQERED